ncbi:integrase [Methylovirgula ligni]|uniref:Integrase n=1 Tax=Methylovirgula ligni TaxID=569860 RepID=A0A3D9Z7P1_9HYPH|nr:site-specific integrase [Methylovirgula ligni]QAY95146.1 integrase [Methylovirgula ligni]REF89569.1 integrase [Methylovirgula ligni]
MRSGNRLTALTIKNADKPGLYGDGHGLYLQVSAFGTKSWLFRFMRNGVARKMGLGALHTVSLGDARKRAAAARLAVHDGEDPIEMRAAARAATRVEKAKAITFKECAEAYIKANESTWKNLKHRDQWHATFNQTKRGKKTFPAATAAINDLPVVAIDTGLILKALEPIWHKTPETASRVRGRIEAVLNWAAVRNYRSGENPARWRGHLDNVLPLPGKVQRVKHHPAVPYAEMPAFMADLRSREGVSARALEFTILTAVRTCESIGATWKEFDLDAKVWTIPADRMKAGKEHRVPLSDRTIVAIASLPREGKYVFPGAKADKPLSNMAMLELLRGMRQGTTVHGFRSTFRDWAAERTAHPNHVVEMSLAHAIGDKVEAAYRRGELLEKRHRLMDDWATYCERSVVARADNVVTMRGTA